ncbi:MAG: hypothetical protein ACWGNP_01995 [Candidatus Bathyarchaeia archaeon]
MVKTSMLKIGEGALTNELTHKITTANKDNRYNSNALNLNHGNHQEKGKVAEDEQSISSFLLYAQIVKL